ncbi:ABC transporter permease [Mycobacterium sp. pUA109]|uniref:ABC transporter permease n=1 Tax=Mycobacterium sp. pUA109 TaxID=3238982 RepID=UPI00351B8D40
MSTQSLPEHGQQPAAVHVTPAPVRAGGVVVGLVIALAIICLAFAWPAARSRPHDLPIGAAAPLSAGQLQSQLDQITPSGFAVISYPDQDALRSAIRHRNIYGGLTTGPQGITLLTASGASPAVAQLLTQVGAGLAQHRGTPLHTEDLVPLPAHDPRGTGLAAAALPLTLAGLLPAIVLILVFPRDVWLRFAATLAFSVLAGLTIATLLRHVFGSIDHNFAGVTAGLTLGALAMSLSLLGLGSLFGRVGLGVGAVIAVLLGNPLSGLMSAPEMLPRGWGALGQLLPQGANATLLRSTAYFAGAGSGTAILVLTGWAVAGALLIVIAGTRNRA